MRVKDHEKNNSYVLIQTKVLSLFRHLFRKKIMIFLIVLGTIMIFVLGHISGLLIVGFFGSLDKPSEKGSAFLRTIGIPSGLKNVVRGIAKENIKIPFNFFAGWFSNPERIYIDIGFEDYQKLLYKRSQYLDKEYFEKSNEDYVPAKIRYNDKKIDVKLRLKGDTPDHLSSNKFSLRIQVKGDETLFGMKTFSIQHPRTRQYLNEYIFHEALGREDVLSLRYIFIEVVINGKNKGIYALEEHFDKHLIEDNKMRESIIIKFNEDEWFRDLVQKAEKQLSGYHVNGGILTNYQIGERNISRDKEDVIKELQGSDIGFFDSNIDSFNTNKVLSDPVQSAQFNKAKDLLESFRLRKLRTRDVFDLDKLAEYFALVSVLGAEHGAEWGNIRFYYNPITSKLEPIGFDGNAGIDNYKIVNKYFPRCVYIYELSECSSQSGNYYTLLFSDSKFFEKYIIELERFSKKEYLDKLFKDLEDGINRNLKILHKDMPYYHFSKDVFYENQEYVRDILNPDKRSINPYFEEYLPFENALTINIGNTDLLPVEILETSYNEIIFKPKERIILQPRDYSGLVKYEKIIFVIPNNLVWNESYTRNIKVKYKIFGTEVVREREIIPWKYIDEDFSKKDFIRQKPNEKESEFLIIDEDTKRINVREGNWILNKSLMIPLGFKFVAGKKTILDLKDGALILSYSPLEFIGTKSEPVKIISSDGTGQGLTVIMAKEKSILKNVVFDNLSYPSKSGWELTGAVNFYESPINLENVVFSNARAEDSLNVIRSEFEMEESIFEGALSDCFDIDFSKGNVSSSSFNKCGNDALDFSGSEVSVYNIKARNIGDKGISAGEKSRIDVNGFDVEKAFIGATSKDESELNIVNINIVDSNYSFSAYQKKSEFGPASIIAVNATIFPSQNNYIIEKGSDLILDGRIILGTEKKVYDKLYPVGK